METLAGKNKEAIDKSSLTNEAMVNRITVEELDEAIEHYNRLNMIDYNIEEQTIRIL